MIRRSIFENGKRWLSTRRFYSTATPSIEKHPDALKRFIVDKIKSTGPITVAEYMKLAVSSPSVGYYSRFSERKQVFGEKGDFITAPELTQMFGELIGIWCYHELANTGYTGDWFLVENGPGTGQLMFDVLSSLHKFQEKKVSIHLVETANALIDAQEKTLCGSNSPNLDSNAAYIRKNQTTNGFPIFWYNNIDDIPANFSVFISNEFLDALPIHQFQKCSKWHEIYVNLNHVNELIFMISPGENLHTRGLLPENVRQSEKQIWEIAPEAGIYVNQIVERMVSFEIPFLLRAYSQHQETDPLLNPGQVDMTADVNFGYLRSLVDDRSLVFGPQTQREFFGQLGIQHRLMQLLKSCNEREKQEDLIKGYNYLLGEMGERFKVLSLFPKTLQSIMEKRKGPAGFAK
ncbi:unnamed protein product, partial [Mesorhabditis belari]|uniref:Protein arginine methyltransferase NDUFAF7 n=1 Tax=Mesorhabditis belari TaxID=2138241 RepID=A0AAF3EBM0_9BILA